MGRRCIVTRRHRPSRPGIRIWIRTYTGKNAYSCFVNCLTRKVVEDTVDEDSSPTVTSVDDEDATSTVTVVDDKDSTPTVRAVEDEGFANKGASEEDESDKVLRLDLEEGCRDDVRVAIRRRGSIRAVELTLP